MAGFGGLGCGAENGKELEAGVLRVATINSLDRWRGWVPGVPFQDLRDEVLGFVLEERLVVAQGLNVDVRLRGKQPPDEPWGDVHAEVAEAAGIKPDRQGQC